MSKQFLKQTFVKSQSVIQIGDSHETSPRQLGIQVLNFGITKTLQTD